MLHVIAVISNPVQFKSRYALYEKFKAKILTQGVKLYTVECAFGDRIHAVTTPDGSSIQLRTYDEIWHKENMINLGIEFLTRAAPDWQYVAWIDADVSFIDDAWAHKTIQALQHYMIVQPWQTGIDLGPKGEALQTHTSFGFCVVGGKTLQVNWKPYYIYPHSGYAWAARREALEGVGLLYDRAILGSGDHHMAWSLIGKGRDTLPAQISQAYVDDVVRWQDRAVRVIQKDIGFVPGTLLHDWHGKKVDRRYVPRWAILEKWQYNPLTDLIKDSQGLYQLVNDGSERMIGMRDDIRAYFRQRNEDSIDLE